MRRFDEVKLMEDPETVLDAALAEAAGVVIERPDGRGVAMLPLREYESLKETAYLLGTRANSERLWSAIDSLDSRDRT
ncbi:type II toxin-antitoxin system Phd/YefM family antitoxin [Demequina silvatica]|uniref:type II toxin-antitoxin system Phd/YefM family antitoxin n=1 Tax=Demequina silvatica TaxID=1638988 RepID=UPI000781E9B6|nr:type II toxin-antitoxin system Phd/YefM family antitoxin [Demequina silvatica]